MKIEYKDAVEFLNYIDIRFGIIGVFLLIVIVISMIVLYKYLSKKTESIAEEASKKSLALFQSDIDINLQKYQKVIELAFRNENIRSSLHTQIAFKSILAKIKIWEKMYQLYFEYQKSWSIHKKMDQEYYNKLFSKIQILREKIFIQSFYLGGYMTDRLIKLNNNIRNNLNIQYMKEVEGVSETYGQLIIEKYHKEEEISQILQEIPLWLIDQLYTDQTIKMHEFTAEQNNFLNEQVKEIINPQTHQQN